MNKDRRKRLAEATDLIERAQSLLEKAAGIVEEVRDEEQDAFNNMPESLQDGERGQRMQEAIDALDNVDLDGLLTGALENLNAAVEA